MLIKVFSEFHLEFTINLFVIINKGMKTKYHTAFLLKLPTILNA